jgi:hypothetical protein
MPCDFADSQMPSQRRYQQSLAPRAISHRTELAEVNGGRDKVVGGGPAVFLWLRRIYTRSRPYRPGIEPCF